MCTLSKEETNSINHPYGRENAGGNCGGDAGDSPNRRRSATQEQYDWPDSRYYKQLSNFDTDIEGDKALPDIRRVDLQDVLQHEGKSEPVEEPDQRS